MHVLKVYMIKVVVNFGITFIRFIKSVTIKLLVILIVLDVLLMHIMLMLCGRIKVCIVLELKLNTVLSLQINYLSYLKQLKIARACFLCPTLTLLWIYRSVAKLQALMVLTWKRLHFEALN